MLHNLEINKLVVRKFNNYFETKRVRVIIISSVHAPFIEVKTKDLSKEKYEQFCGPLDC